VFGAAGGSSTISVEPPEGIPPATPIRTVSVVVRNKVPQMDDLELGKNLAGGMVVNLPFQISTTTPVRVTVSDPSVALLAVSSRSLGQQQISVSPPNGQLSATFFVYAIAASGKVRVTVDVPGAGSVTANVTIVPSGFGWAGDFYSAPLYGPPPAASIRNAVVTAYALDPVSLAPVSAQTLRPDLTASVIINNTNPEVVSLNPGTVTFQPPGLPGVVLLTGRSVGNAVLTVAQPIGFSPPSSHQQLNVRLLTPTQTIFDATVARNTQVGLTYSSFLNVDLPVTVTSGDPSRAPVTSDPNVPGSASATVCRTTRVYLQALDDHGTVIVTASSPTFNDGTATITLAPLGIGVNVANGASTLVDGRYNTTTQSGRTSLRMGLYSPPGFASFITANSRLLPGLASQLLEVVSSNPAVGIITGGPIRLGDIGSAPVLNFVPLSPGETDITVVQPPGFTALPGSSKLTFKVSAP
jgi:hypothetical protein